MKFSQQWLRNHVNPPLDTEQLSHVLTMAGLEVEQVEAVAGEFSGVVVARVVTVAPHPQADRLRVCQVDAGTGLLLQIVCGAPNVREGVVVPCAMVGAKLPGMAIGQARLRGVDSAGMLCSATELGLPAETSGLLLLADDAPIGMDLREYLMLDDQVFTLKLTPNRSDCLSIVGIARDVGAVTGIPVQVPDATPVEPSTDIGVDVRIDAPAACPLYVVRRIDGLNPAAATPDWMRRRLERSGLRSLGAIVDVTNYILLELGQPLHAFDASKLTGGLCVRMARHGETIALLNDQTVTLSDDMLVIADDAGAQALAGMMGGAASAVDGNTTCIVLEAAFFAPAVIAGRPRRLGITTDSGYRFERGVDFTATRQALERATRLLLQICGGAAGPVIEKSGLLPERKPVGLRLGRVKRVLGFEMSRADMRASLERLGMLVSGSDDVWQVTPPGWRFDIEREVDLIEELARLHGYEHMVALTPRASVQMLPMTEWQRPVDRLLRLLAARDYQEVITYSFVDPAMEAELAPDVAPIRLQNPIASQMSVMRSTLMGGMLDVLHANLNRRQERVRIMEAGRCFLRDGTTFAQPQRLAGLAYGPQVAEQWGEAERPVDFFDVKADIEALFHPMPVRMHADHHPALHPGQSARVEVAGKMAGWLGSLHPALVQSHGLAAAPVMFELELDSLLLRPLPVAVELSRFQQVRRDIAIVVDQNVSVQSLLDAMLTMDVSCVTNVAIFDSYRGKHIDYDKKSLAFRVLMQDNQKTLTDEEVEDAVRALTEMLQQRYGAQLRS